MLLTACSSPLTASTGGYGSLSVGLPEDRETGGIAFWAKRGATAGELARAYCVEGSKRERQWFRDAFDHHASPARVLITCPGE